MSGTLYLFEEEEFRPSSKDQREAARKEIAALKAKTKEADSAPESKDGIKANDQVQAEDSKPARASAKKNKPLAELSSKQYYNIGEVAAYFGLNVSHIRHWTTEFKLKVRKTKKGDRLYNEDNIEELKRIYSLMKEQGMTIKGAKMRLQAVKSKSQPVQLQEALMALRQQLAALSSQLQQF